MTDSRVPQTLQTIARMTSMMTRAMFCGRFSPAEGTVLSHVIEQAWIIPKCQGENKAIPVVIVASKLAEAAGFDRVTIHRALVTLRDGMVILKRGDGWIPNADWRAWMIGDPKSDVWNSRILESCWGYVENGLGPNEPAHVCVAPTTQGPSEGVAPTTQGPSALIVNAPACARASEENYSSSGFSEDSRSLEKEKILSLSQVCTALEPAPTHAGAHGHAHEAPGEAEPDTASRDAHLRERNDIPSFFYSMDGSLPGPFEPDPDKWATLDYLIQTWFPMRGFEDHFSLIRRCYPTHYFIKAVKRTILTKPKVKRFQYLKTILETWTGPDGPDAGPEDGFDDRMNSLNVPTVLFEPKPLGAPDQPAFDDETNQEFMRAMNAELRRYRG